MREYRDERQRQSSYDAGQGASPRAFANERTPEELATGRVYRLRQDVESAAASAKRLAALVQRDEWRAEHEKLKQAHTDLASQLEERTADARMSEQAQQHHAAAAHELGELKTTLTAAKEPRAKPPVHGEEAIEPRIIDRTIPPDDVLLWVSELDIRQRGELAERVRRVQGSADRSDGFSVALANYLAAMRISTEFFGVAANPRRFNRAAYKKSRAPANASRTAGGASLKASDTRAGEDPPPVAAALDSAAPAFPLGSTSGEAPAELPYRTEIEQSFGRSLGHVEAYTGMGNQLGSYGAQALASGSVVAFADASPAPPVVAHEVAHTVQNEQADAAAAMASGVVAPRDSPAEAEADAINSRWGGDGVRALLAAEQRLSAASSSAAAAPASSAPAVTSSSGPVALASSAATVTSASSSAHAAPAAGSTQHHSPLDRAVAMADLGHAHLAAIQTELVPAYRRAVAAMDTSAVRALALQIVGGVARIVDAQAHVVRLVPQVDTGPHAVTASTAETDPGTPDPTELATLTAKKAALDAAVLATVPKLALQVSPQWFGDELVAGHAEPPPHVRDVLVQLTYEAGLVVELLEEADSIETLIRPIEKVRGSSEPTTEGARCEAVDHLERWKGRPINFLFLARVLTKRGLWQSMQGIQDASGHTAAELQRRVFVQSKETGATADVGEEWDAEEAHRLLSYDRFDWKITDDEASRVFEMLTKAEPRARGELVKQLYRMGRLDALCEHLPWGLVKQLWESIPDAAASKLLEPYWADKGGGRSLGKRLEEQDHWYAHALNKFLNIATLGAKSRIDAAYDAREEGLITDDAYWSSVNKAIGRAALTMAAMAATGGIAGEFGAGAAEGIGLGRLGTAAVSGAAAGATANVAGHFVGDIYDQVLDGKEGFDSVGAYARGAGEGAAIGGVASTIAAGVGLAAARYLPKGARTIAQEAAVAQPRSMKLLEAARSAGRGAGLKVRTTVHDLCEMLGGGGWPPGFRPAYAAAAGALPPRIAAAPSGAVVLIGIRPLVDLNAPMQMQGGGGGDLVEVESMELAEEIQGMFDELSSAEGHMHPEGESFANESSRLGESGPELDAVSMRETKAKAGVVENPGEVASHQHHVFPQRYRAWFHERGINVDDYCIELIPPEHQAQHGGGDSTLARQVAKDIPDAEWSAGLMKRLLAEEQRIQKLSGDPHARLTPDEIIEQGKRFMAARDVGKLPFRRYSRRRYSR